MALSERRQRHWIVVGGVAVTMAFVWVAVRHLELGAVRRTWATSHPFPWVLLSAGCYLLGHLVRGARCRLLLGVEANLSLMTASNIVVAGYASNNILPARLGELVRAGMLVQQTGIPITQALTVTLVERLLDGLAIVLLLLVAIAIAPAAPSVAHVAYLGFGVFALAIAVMAVAAAFPSTVVSIVSSSSARFGKLHDKIVRAAVGVTRGAAFFRHPRVAARVAFLSLIVWALEAMMFALILPAFSLPLRFGIATAAMGVTNLGILIPSTPGYVGPFHFFCASTLEAYGVPAEVALSFAVLVHVTFFVPVTIWGGLALLRSGVEVASTIATVRRGQAAPAVVVHDGVPVHMIATLEREPDAEASPALYVALVRAMLPADPEPSPEVTQQVARFTRAQIRSLPSRLRLMFQIGLLGFRVFPRLRYGRSFCALPLEKQRAVVELWAYGNVGLLRQFFRPLRSLALLGYYDGAPATTQPRVGLVRLKRVANE